MEKTKLNFYCPTATVEVIDSEAKADHRDRTSLLNKMIDFYFIHHPPKTPPTNGAKPAAATHNPPKRYPYRGGKAGAR